MRTFLFVDLLLAAAVSHNTSVRGFGPIRHFVHAATAIGHDEDVSHKIRILNWNILAPSWDNNVGKKDKSAQWPLRLPKLMHEMRLRKPDIIVLQEVEVILWEEQIKPFLKSHGFQSAYACSESGMGIAVLWRHSRFDLGNTVEVDLGDASNSRWLAQKQGTLNKDQQSRFFSKGHPGLLIVLGIKSSSKLRKEQHALLVGAAYIVANPISLLPMRLDIQAVQTLMLMDSMERVLEHESRHYASLSVVVAGDFNVPPYYPQMSFDLLSKHIAQEGDFDQMATTVMQGVASGKFQTFVDPNSEQQTIASPVYELITKGVLGQDSIGFLVAAIKSAGYHPSRILEGPLYQMLTSKWLKYQMISAYAHVLGMEPMTNALETLDFVFFLPAQRRPDHSRAARLAVTGVLAAPPPQSRHKLVAGLGSDHIPLVVDVGLCTPSKSGEVESQRREDNTTSPVVNITHSPPSCDSSSQERILELLASLERRLETLDSKVSKPCMFAELKWALVASTLGSVLFAASTMLLGVTSALVRQAMTGCLLASLLYQGFVVSKI